MAGFGWRNLCERLGHVIAYAVAAVVGYQAAGEVLGYFFDRFGPDGGLDAGNPFLAILAAVIQGGFAVVFSVFAALLVFVAIVGVGGAVLSRIWGRLAPGLLY